MTKKKKEKKGGKKKKRCSCFNFHISLWGHGNSTRQSPARRASHYLSQPPATPDSSPLMPPTRATPVRPPPRISPRGGGVGAPPGVTRGGLLIAHGAPEARV